MGLNKGCLYFVPLYNTMTLNEFYIYYKDFGLRPMQHCVTYKLKFPESKLKLMNVALYYTCRLF